MKKKYYNCIVTGIHKIQKSKLELSFIGYEDKEFLKREMNISNFDMMKKNYNNFKVKKYTETITYSI